MLCYPKSQQNLNTPVMKYLYTLCLVCSCLLVDAQNPIVVKAVTSSILKPQNKNQSYWEYNQWNGKVFYQGSGTGINLCVTDGTSAGTVFLANLYNGSFGGSINYVIPAQDFVYLVITRIISFPPFVTDQQIWKSDGTAAGTVLVSTVNVSGLGFYRGTSKAIIGNTLLFAGSDATNGVELWKTDGTAATTVLVKDIKPGAGNSDPGAFCKIGNDIYFRAYSNGFEGKLWKTDGTEGGTVQIPVAEPFFMVNWDMIALNNKLIFFGDNTVDGYEPYVSDGTAAGTFMLANINPVGNSLTTVAQGLHLKATDNFTFFIANKGSSTALWRTDGTVAGTVQLTGDALNATNNISDAGYSATDKNNLWFMQYAGASGSSSILYKSNGTVNGTSQIISNSSYGQTLKVYKGALWYSSRDVASLVNIEPWRSDGLAANTNRAIDVVAGAGSSNPYGFFELNNQLFFWGDGTAGTHNLYQFNSDFTFNGSLTGGRWRDSANWNSRMPPGITDTVHINAGTPNTLNINGATAYAGLLNINSGAAISINGATDSLYINNGLNAANNPVIAGAGVLAFKNVENKTVQIDKQFMAGNVAIMSNTNAVGRPGEVYDKMEVSGNLNLVNDARVSINNLNILIPFTSSTLTQSGNSYINTNGTGLLRINNVGPTGKSGNVLFPIGNGNNYNPVIINNTGTTTLVEMRTEPRISSVYYGDSQLPSDNYTANAVDNTWYISAGGSPNIAITLQWNESQELPGFVRTQTNLGHYTGGSWDVGTAVAATGSNPYTITRTGITSFSPFGILNNNSTLPLRFLSFSAQKCNSSNVCLNWKTASEQDVSHFEIERSSDGINFTTIKTIPAHNQSFNKYSITDDISNLLTATTIWYRIREVENDGRYNYSTIQFIKKNQASVIYLYPNPARGMVNIFNWQEVKEIQIFDVAGRKLQQWNGGISSIDLSTLANGAYFVKLQLINGSYTEHKLIKE